MDFIKYTDAYLKELTKALDSLEKEQLRAVVETLRKARDGGRQVFVFGNGGSAATASHFVNDLAKGAVGADGRRFKAICLSDSIPLMLAWGNDTSFENIFVEQLKNLMNAGDVVVGISGSGNSANVLKAVEYANKNGGITVGLSGFGGGKLSKLARHAVVVGSEHMGRVEDAHLVVAHLVAYYLKGC